MLRFAFGVNVAMHGFSRFGDLPGFVAAMTQDFADTPISAALVIPFAWVVAPLEALIGSLLIVGLFTRFTLVIGILLMAALTFGVCLQQRWDVAGLQVQYMLVYALLIAGLGLNRYALDFRWAERGGLS